MSKAYKFGAIIKTYWILKLSIIILLAIGESAMNFISFSKYYREFYNKWAFGKKIQKLTRRRARKNLKIENEKMKNAEL